MLEESSTLLTQKREVEIKQQLLDAFNQHFLLSNEDLSTLTSSAEPVDEHFFELLARAKRIHKDCELLLGYENQRLGLELLEQTTRNLDAAYKKLHHWTQREFKSLDLEDPQINAAVRRSLRALSERPALFHSCLDSFAQARQAILSEAFQRALTSSTLSTSKAIEFSTHDPLRYVGDMLAWVHSATVSEMEALEGLFISDADEIGRGLREGRTTDLYSQMDVEDVAFDGHAALNGLTSRNMAQVAAILTQRVSLTVRNLSDPLEIYKVYNLVLFYHNMLSKLIHQTVANAQDGSHLLLSTLTDLSEQTLSHFKSSVYELQEAAFQQESSPPSSLAPPQILQTMLFLQSEIVKLRLPNLTADEYQDLHRTLVQPVVEHCDALNPSENIVADEDAKTDDMIWKLNYLAPIVSALKTVNLEPVAPQIEQYTATISETRHALSNTLSDTFVEKSGLDALIHLLLSSSNNSNDAHPATRQKHHILASGHLEHLAAQLDTFLSNTLVDAETFTARVQDQSLSKQIVAEAVQSFILKFQQIRKGLDEIDDAVEKERSKRGRGMVNGLKDASGKDSDDEDGSEDADDEEQAEKYTLLREIYPRTTEEVEALLS